MPISQKPFLPDIESGEPIPAGRLAYLQERTRNLLYEFVLNKFLEAEKNGLTRAALARRTRHRPEVITRLLGSPGNWRISTVSDLLAGISGEELVPSSTRVDGHAQRNNLTPEWLPTVTFAGGSGKSTFVLDQGSSGSAGQAVVFRETAHV